MEMLKKILWATLLIIIASFLLGAYPFRPQYQFHYAIGCRVGNGDTLWGIAQHYYKLQDKEDIREFIYDIREYNGLQPSSVLEAGKIIEIPIYKRVEY